MTTQTTIDLSGGLDIAREYVAPELPDTPGLREAVNMWLWDDRGEIGFPRVAAESEAPDWGTRDLHMTLAFKGGRILRNWGRAAALPVDGPRGRGTIFGAGPMLFECVEPFRRYRTVFKGTATDTTFEALLRGDAGGRTVELDYEVECEVAVPPWVQGALQADAQKMMDGEVEGAFMGGDRLEQLMRAKGRVKVDGVEHAFTGGGLRIRRRGVRQLAGFWGHSWQSAVFPSGRAFGYIAYPPRPDGSPSFNEGYIYEGEGRLIPARVVEAPWLTELGFDGQDVGLVLETDRGRVRIEGDLMMGAPLVPQTPDTHAVPPLVQSISRFRWDGETAYGMTERSNMPDRIRR